MPKQSPIPDELDKPFWEALNNDKLVIQNCSACDRLQHPPQPTCGGCGGGGPLKFTSVSAGVRILSNTFIATTKQASWGEVARGGSSRRAAARGRPPRRAQDT